MLRGYRSKDWQQEYERTYTPPANETRQENKKRQLTISWWQKKVIQTLWGQLIILWKLRNNECHGWDKESRELARRDILHKELAHIYQRKHEYPVRVQSLLRESYERHTTETVTKIADWLDAYKGTFDVTWSPD